MQLKGIKFNYQILGSCDNGEIETAELHKELASYSVGNTIILAQEAAGTRSARPLTPSEAECNHSRHVPPLRPFLSCQL